MINECQTHPNTNLFGGDTLISINQELFKLLKNRSVWLDEQDIYWDKLADMEILWYIIHTDNKYCESLKM